MTIQYGVSKRASRVGGKPFRLHRTTGKPKTISAESHDIL